MPALFTSSLAVISTDYLLRVIVGSTSCLNFFAYTGCTQKNGAVSKVNKKFISHLTRAQRTPSAVATVQVFMR